MPRYDDRLILLNKDPLYRTVLKRRGLTRMMQYETAIMRYPTPEDLRDITRVRHIWKVGDKFYKVANSYYLMPEYWWVIAWYNKTPSESDLEIGSVVLIPTPLEAVLDLFGR